MVTTMATVMRWWQSAITINAMCACPCALCKCVSVCACIRACMYVCVRMCICMCKTGHFLQPKLKGRPSGQDVSGRLYMHTCLQESCSRDPSQDSSDSASQLRVFSPVTLLMRLLRMCHYVRYAFESSRNHFGRSHLLNKNVTVANAIGSAIGI